MNYGYDSNPHNKVLFTAIKSYLKTLPPDSCGNSAYAELDKLYKGVRIRGLTYYSQEILDQIIEDCDKIYEVVVHHRPIQKDSNLFCHIHNGNFKSF